MIPGVRVVGVDGCRGGWAVVTLDDGRVTSVAVHPLLAGVLEAAEAAATPVGIDMPIGLLDGPRSCDREARRMLGPRRASVFDPPPRCVVDDATLDWPDALARSREVTGRGFSKQAWHLLPRLRELDALMTPERQSFVAEVHPELAFARLAGGEPRPDPKRTPAGRADRRALLAGVLDEDRMVPPRGAATDDVLDAVAVALATVRWVAGGALVLGDGAVDARGLRCSIVG